VESSRRLAAEDGTSLTYWIWRAEGRSAPPLLLIHGAASNHTRWSEFLERTSLKARWDILRPDMRGNGQSMARGRLDREVWSRDLATILTAEGYPWALLVGHSLGAQIAVAFAWRYPDLARGLVLIDPVFHRALIGRQRRLYCLRPFIRAAAWATRALNSLGIRRNRFSDRDLRLLDEETREALRGDAPLEEIARRYGALGPILRHMPTANYLQQFLATVAPLPDLAAIRCPVLVVLSAGSTVADTAINREEIERFPHGEVATVEANHWPLTEKPDEVRRAIEAWVERTVTHSSDRRS